MCNPIPEHECPSCLVMHTGDYELCDYCCELDQDDYEEE